MAQQIKATVRQISDSTSEARARQHVSLVDRPEAKGGADRGPMGGELMLMGLGGCFMSNLLAAANARDMAVTDAAVEVSAVLEQGPPRFTDIVLTVTSGYADRGALQAIVDLAERECISVNTMKTAVPLAVRVG